MRSFLSGSLFGLVAVCSALANMSYNVADGFPTSTGHNPNAPSSCAYSAPGDRSTNM
jgi:hypothetical protein